MISSWTAIQLIGHLASVVILKLQERHVPNSAGSVEKVGSFVVIESTNITQIILS